jgi:tetratricopeptide (TPR) repeat protein
LADINSANVTQSLVDTLLIGVAGNNGGLSAMNGAMEGIQKRPPSPRGMSLEDCMRTKGWQKFKVQAANSSATTNQYKLANGLMTEKKWAELEGFAKKWTEDSSNNPNAFEFLGIALNYQFKHQEAIDAYSKSISLNTKKSDITYLNRGLAYGGLKDYHSAILDFNRCIEINPKSEKCNLEKNKATIALIEQYSKDALYERVLYYSKDVTIDTKGLVDGYRAYALMQIAKRTNQFEGQKVDEVIGLYKKSSDSGEPSSALNLGMFYWDGKIVKQDKILANSYLLRGSELESATAQLIYGKHLIAGDGVEKNKANGLYWIVKASNNPKASPAIKEEANKIIENSK